MAFHRRRVEGRIGLHSWDEGGATSVEYGLMASLITLVIIVGVRAFGASVNGLFQFIIASRPFG